MKLNLDCIRDILLQMEKAEYQEPIYPGRLYSALDKYSEDEINYTIIKMLEAGFITGVTKSRIEYATAVIRLDDITYHGHQFLADIRSDSIWNKTKSVLNDIGSTSISSAIQVASGVIQTLISARLGL